MIRNGMSFFTSAIWSNISLPILITNKTYTPQTMEPPSAAEHRAGLFDAGRRQSDWRRGSRGLKASLPAVIAETSRTSAYGDRSDNAEYKEAKGILRRTHGQIFNIEDQLRRVVLIPSSTSAAGTIQLGSTVIVEIKKDGASSGAAARKTFRILGSSETDPGHGRISHTSPLGAALLGQLWRRSGGAGSRRNAGIYRSLR